MTVFWFVVAINIHCIPLAIHITIIIHNFNS